MPLDNVILRARRRHVETFLDAAAWEHLGGEDRHELVEHVAGLPTSVTDPDVDAKRVDLLCLRMQFAPLRKAFTAQVQQLEARRGHDRAI